MTETKLSQYHINLDDGQQKAEERLSKLIETDVLILGPDEFRTRFLSYLKEEKKTPLSEWYYEETGISGEVQVLAEQQASFCTLILAFNEQGQARLLHFPLVDFIDSEGQLNARDRGISEVIEKIKNFVKERNGLLLITGTNTNLEERAKVTKVFEDIEEQKIITLFTSQEPSDQQYADLKNNIQGIVFIPKQLSSDGRNKILLLGQKISKELFEEAVRPVDLMAST